MVKKFSSLLLGIIVSAVSLTQFHQSLTSISTSDVFLEEVEIDTSNFTVEDQVMINRVGNTKVKLEQYTVNVGKVNPLKFKYVSRLGQGLNFVQVMDIKTLEEFNPFALMNFLDERSQVLIQQDINPERVESEATGMSEVLVVHDSNYWTNVKIFTSVHFWNNSGWISSPDKKVQGDTIFVFSILSVIDSTVLTPNIIEIKGSFAQKVKFYD